MFGSRHSTTLGRIAMPEDEKLWRELMVPTREPKNGKTIVEAKHEIKKRLGARSPDRADAVVYGNWVRPRAGSPTAIRQPAARDQDTTEINFDDTDGPLVSGSFTQLPAGF